MIGWWCLLVEVSETLAGKDLVLKLWCRFCEYVVYIFFFFFFFFFFKALVVKTLGDY